MSVPLRAELAIPHRVNKLQGAESAQKAWQTFQSKDANARKAAAVAKLQALGLPRVPVDHLAHHHVYPKSLMPKQSSVSWNAVRVGPSHRLDDKGDTFDPNFANGSLTPRSQAMADAHHQGHVGGPAERGASARRACAAATTEGDNELDVSQWYVSTAAVDRRVGASWKGPPPQAFSVPYRGKEHGDGDPPATATAYAWQHLHQSRMTPEAFAGIEHLFASGEPVFVRHGNPELQAEAAKAESLRELTQKLGDPQNPEHADRIHEFKKAFGEEAFQQRLARAVETAHTAREALTQEHGTKPGRSKVVNALVQKHRADFHQSLLPPSAPTAAAADDDDDV